MYLRSNRNFFLALHWGVKREDNNKGEVMKKIMSMALTGLLAATVAHAASNEVYSVNVVGFQKLDARSNGFMMVNVPFDAASNTLDGIIGTQLVGHKSSLYADNIMIWDPVTQSYSTYFKKTDNLWYDSANGLRATNVYITSDMGMWVRNRQATNQQVTLVGDVVDDSVITNVLLEGYNLVSYPFSSEININDSCLTNGYGHKSSLYADNIMLWDDAAQAYNTYFLKTDKKWYDASNGILTTNTTIGQGKGFWFRRRGAGDLNWVEQKPYNLE